MPRTRGSIDRQNDAIAQLPQPDDARLIERIATGELHAFEEIYRIYRPRLMRFLMNVGRRPLLVDEVIDDTMLVVWNTSRNYKGQSQVSTWIFAIAYRKALKALRRHDEPIEDKHRDFRVSAEAGPEQKLEQRQMQKVLLDAMDALSADHRAVVDLTYFHDFGYREIAEIMGCPVDTVKTRMYHARRYLKKVLAGQLSDWL